MSATLAAMATGAELGKSAEQSWRPNNSHPEQHPAWPALVREMDDLDPSYRN